MMPFVSFNFWYIRHCIFGDRGSFLADAHALHLLSFALEHE